MLGMKLIEESLGITLSCNLNNMASFKTWHPFVISTIVLIECQPTTKIVAAKKNVTLIQKSNPSWLPWLRSLIQWIGWLLLQQSRLLMFRINSVNQFKIIPDTSSSSSDSDLRLRILEDQSVSTNFYGRYQMGLCEHYMFFT